MSPRSLLIAILFLGCLPVAAQVGKSIIPVYTFQAMLEAGQYSALHDSAKALRDGTSIGDHYILDYYIAMALCKSQCCEEKRNKWWAHLLDEHSPPPGIRALFERSRNSCRTGQPESETMITALSGIRIESGVRGNGTPDQNRVREKMLLIEQEKASHAIILEVLGRLSVADDPRRSKAIEAEIEFENKRHTSAVDSLRDVYMDPSARGIKEENEEIRRRNEEVQSLGSLTGTAFSEDGQVKPLPYLIPVEPAVEGEPATVVKMDAMEHARWMTRAIAPGSVAVEEIAEP
ncbi:MAG: hypothetical protein IPK70_07140 [Flavobacteriales bacterium]|jgi:hypothetical protein|nr:hypothetical protein [Flavobacteriales bacterium]